MIDNLNLQFRDNNIGIACLYANYKDQKNQTVVNILGSLLRQFLITVPEPIPTEIIQELDNIRNCDMKAETPDILRWLKIRLRKLRRAFICIDAVDELELEVRKQLFGKLRELTNTRLFLTGRGHIEDEIQKHFKVAQRYRVNITASDQNIREFLQKEIADQITDDGDPDMMDDRLAKDIEDTITRKSRGM